MDLIPRMFIASSTEGLRVAEAVREQLAHDNIEVQIWSDPGIFELSETTIESLEIQLNRFDFALIVVTPDDILKFRSREFAAPRDNLILELGLFIGRIGRRRAFILRPKESTLKLPTDLAGVTVAEFRQFLEGGDVRLDVGAACNKIKRAMKKAPPPPVDTLLETLLFPKIVLRYCRTKFEEYLGDPSLPRDFRFDAQITTCDQLGTIMTHPSKSSKGHNACIHEGRVLWASFSVSESTRPFRSCIESHSESGWILWTDAGYSVLYTPISARHNNRICVAFFKHRQEVIEFMEIHHELSQPLIEETSERVSRILGQRIMEVDKEFA